MCEKGCDETRLAQLHEASIASARREKAATARVLLQASRRCGRSCATSWICRHSWPNAEPRGQRPTSLDCLGPFAWNQTRLIGWSPKRTKLRTCGSEPGFQRSHAMPWTGTSLGSARHSRRQASEQLPGRKAKSPKRGLSLSVSRLGLRNCRLQVDLWDLP